MLTTGSVGALYEVVMPGQPSKVLSVVILMLGAGALGYAGGTYSSSDRGPVSELRTVGAKLQQAPFGEADSTSEAVPEAREVGQAFVVVAARVAPSVVRITSTQRAERGPQRGGESGPGPLNPFEGTPFERFFEDIPEMGPSEPRMGMGSGVVLDEDGHILTNHHVVQGADDIRVTFMDGEEAAARIVGTDPKSDLAVIYVEGGARIPATFGDSERMRVGEWVMAIGNPFGLDHSVTVGVLSAKGRYGFAAGKLEDFLQTDASINPGNSGGPLVNLRGEVIGINTMIAGIGTGIGFAVPTSMARPIAKQLIETGTVSRPYIGVVMQKLTPTLREAMGEDAPEQGALVSEVQRGSPAEKAGILPGDVVMSVEGQPTSDARDVQAAVLARRVGEEVTLGLWRDGQTLELLVPTEELPADGTVGEGEESGRSELGLSLETLSPGIAQRLGLPPSTRGVVVVKVRRGSAAALAGLLPGDVIVSIDRQPVAVVEDAARLLEEERSTGHLLRVRRGGGAIFLVLPSPGGGGGG